MNIVKKTFLILGAALCTMGFTSCSSSDDDGSGSTPSGTLTEDITLRSTTPAEGAEVDAATTTIISLQYASTVTISSKANVTLNGTQVTPAISTVTATKVEISVSLEAGKSYTLIVPSGTILGKDDASRTAKALTLNFTTKKGATDDLPDNDAMKVTRMLGFGWNLGNHFDSDNTDNVEGNYKPNYGYWDNQATPTEALYKKLAAAGIKTVRIPVTWGPYENMTDGNYTIESNFMATVKQNVLWAKAAGLNVILNTHHDEYWLTANAASTNATLKAEIEARIKATWTQISNAFKDEGDYLILETFNELNNSWKTPSAGELTIQNEWNQIAVDAIRATGGNNATRWIAVPPCQASPTYALKDEFKLPTDKANKLIVAVHSYDPYNFTIASTLEEKWGHKSGNSYDESNIDKLMSDLKTKFIDNNIPCYIGEIGCSKHTTTLGEQCRQYYFEYFCRSAYCHGLACCLWDNYNKGAGSEHHAYFDHNNGEYVDDGATLIPLMIKANTSTDNSYTLESIYNKAP